MASSFQTTRSSRDAMASPNSQNSAYLLLPARCRSIVATVLALLVIAGACGAAKEKKHHGDQTGTETLEWAVKLNFDEDDVSRKEADFIADVLADELHLVNNGQIGPLRGIYLFSHPFHEQFHNDRKQRRRPSDDENSVLRPNLANIDLSAVDANTFLEYRRRGGDAKISKEEFVRLKRLVHKALEGHNHIEWYSQQVIHKRYPRSAAKPVKFRDPQFPKQWHLVSRRLSATYLFETRFDFVFSPFLRA